MGFPIFRPACLITSGWIQLIISFLSSSMLALEPSDRVFVDLRWWFRTFNTDPYAQFWSPYVGMGNNPMNGIDPDGGWFGGPGKMVPALDECGGALLDDAGEVIMTMADNLDVLEVVAYKALELVTSDPHTWYYMMRGIGLAQHAMAYNPSTSTIYEVNDARDENGEEVGRGSTFFSGLGQQMAGQSSDKSYGYQWNTNSPEDMAKLWARETKGNVYFMQPVYVSDPLAAEQWFAQRMGAHYNYSIFQNNCSDFARRGLEAGGARVYDCWQPKNVPGIYTVAFNQDGFIQLLKPLIIE